MPAHLTPKVPDRLKPAATERGTTLWDPTKRDPPQAHHQTKPQRSRTNTTNAHHHRAATTRTKLPPKPSHNRVKSPTIRMRRRISMSPVRTTTVEHRVSTTMTRQHWG